MDRNVSSIFIPLCNSCRLNLERGSEKESAIVSFLYEWMDVWFSIDSHKKPFYSELLTVIDTLNGKNSMNFKLLLVKVACSQD